MLGQLVVLHNYQVIAPFFNGDGRIDRSGGPDGAAYYAVVNDASNNPEMLVIEFVHLECYYSPYGDYNFQVRLHKNGNISAVYETSTLSTYSSASQNFFLTNGPSDKVCLEGSYASPTIGTPSSLPNFTTAPAAGEVITFTRPVISCPKPTLTEVNPSTDHASLRWTENGSATIWKVEYSTSSDFSANVQSKTFQNMPAGSITDLNSGTTYYVRVIAMCEPGVDESFPSNVLSFNTECDILYVTEQNPYEQNFDGVTGTTSGTTNNLPLCWNYINETSYSTYAGYPVVYNSSSYAHSGNNYLRLYSYYYNSSYTDYDPQDQYAILPEMQGVNNLRMKLYARAYSTSTSYNATFHVGVMTNPADATTFTEMATYTPTTTTYELYTIPFSSYTGSGRYIAIMIEAAETGSSSFSRSVCIDDIVVEPIPSCVEPDVPEYVEGSAGTESAKVTWTPNGNETSWDLYWSTSETAPTATTTPTAEGVTMTNNEYTIEGLTANTKYYVWVRAHCSATNQSQWSGPGSFTTDCDAYTVTDEEIYTYGFEEEVPFACWTVISGSITLIDGTPNTGSYRLDFRGTTSNMVALPQFTNATSTLALEFYTRPESTGGSSGKFAIGYMTDITDASTFVAVETYNSTEMTTNYVMKTVYFPGAPANAIIAMRQFDCATNYYWYVDDVTVSLAPTCFQPQNLAASDVTNEAATFTWERHAMGTETAWVLQYGTDETFDTYIDEVTVNTNPNYTIESGLTATTTYYVRVKPACDVDGELWSEVIDFTTEADCAAPTGLAVTKGSETVEGATITWNGRNDSFIVERGTYDYTATPTMITVVEEDLEGGSMPTGWTHIGNGSVDYQTSYPHSTSHSIKFSGATSNNVLVLPAFDVEINTMTISYWSKAEGSSSGEFDMGYVTDPTDANTFQAIHTNSYANDNTNYTEVSDISLAAAPAGARIAFRHRAVQTYWYWFLDDITIMGPEYPIAWTPDGPAANENNSGEYIFEGLDDNTTYFARVKGVCGNVESDYSDVVSFTTLDACPAPTNLTVGTVTYNTATISWTGGLATEWKVWIKESTETDYPTTYSTVTTATKSFANLTANTTYDVKIAPTCDETRYLEALEAFTTPCTPITNFPWSEGFEDGELSGCWSQDGDGEWTVGTGDHNTSIGAHTGTYNAMITHGNTGDVTKLITPVLDLTSLNHPMLTFWYINRKWSTDIDGFAVYYRTASDAAWTQIDATEDEHESWTIATYMLPNKSATYQIAFEMTDGYGYGVGIDDITIDEAPSYTLTIEGYEDDDNDDGYYLIASPVTVDPATVEGMTEGDFDLYYFDQAEDDEWRNYETNTFNLEPGKGYLYAHKIGGDFTLAGVPYSGNGKITLSKTVGVDWEGWNLVGNPYAQIAYLERPFYVMNAEGSEIEPAERTSVKAMEGIFVIAENNGDTITFTTESKPGKGQIVLNVTQNRGNVVDRAIVRFGQESMLPKFMLNENHTKMYITKDNEDYAVVRSNKAGELPVNFEPAQNGTFTISVNTENVNVKYLHLIDRATGMDTDLLQTPIYKFDARTNDDPKRFVLVYKTIPGIDIFSALSTKGGNTDDFSFFSNGNWVINNDGDAILQVVDINGQILSSEQINGCVSKSIEAAPGIYMLRLINGENVKVQKIVVQ